MSSQNRATTSLPIAPRPARSVFILQEYFAKNPLAQWQILTHFFYRVWPGVPIELFDATIVGLDAEWYEFGSKEITEVGISTLDPKKTATREGIWGVLDKMETNHVRIREHAHKVNRRLLTGYPENFEFGKTKFVTVDETRKLLKESFSQQNGFGFLRPVIFVGHAVDNDVQMIERHFGVDLNDLNTIVTTIDTQVLAREVGIAGPNVKIGLQTLLSKFEIEGKFLHNAGNDIASTMIAAFLTARFHVRSESPIHPNDLRPTENQYQVDELKALGSSSQAWRPPVHGTFKFCTRCDSTQHVVAQCSAQVSCQKCIDAGRHSDASTHKTEKCILKDRMIGVIPCEHCITSTKTSRFPVAYTHLTEDCRFGPDHTPEEKTAS